MKGFVEIAATTPRTTKSSVDRVRKIHEETRSRVFEATGLVLEGKKGLDIGPDRRLGCLRCFSLSNDVVGIDTDVVSDRIDLVGYARDLRFRAALAIKTARCDGSAASSARAGMLRQKTRSSFRDCCSSKRRPAEP